MRLDLSSAILKATDPKLRTDNWQANLHVCDIVKRDPEENGHDAVQMIQRRLEQNDANVILRSLALTVALAENCGSRLQQEISSKTFTAALYSLIQSKTTHHTVKVEVARVVKQLSKSFESDPSLRSMRDTYKNIKRHYPELLPAGGPGNGAAALPSKSQLSSNDKYQEERDLEEALKLSLQEFESEKKQHESQQQQQQIPQQQAPQQQSAPSTVRKVRAMYDLDSNEPDELSFKKGDIIVVMEQVYRDWWRGSLRGSVGIFPLNYVTPISEPTQQELQQEAQQEGAVFQHKNEVDRLHSVLKANAQPTNGTDITQNPEVGNMYAAVTPLRPQITKMIGKYAREKDDVASLRQVLAQAEHTYNQLLDQAANTYKPVAPQYPQQQSMPYPQQPQMQAAPQQGYPPQQMQTGSQNGYPTQQQQPPAQPQGQPQFAGYPQQYPSQAPAMNPQFTQGQATGYGAPPSAPYPVSANPTGQYPPAQYPGGQYPSSTTQ